MSQNISMDETLAFINSKFGSDCKVNVKNGYILTEISENGTLIRKDKADISVMDVLKTEYNEESKMVILYCTQKECCERKLMGNTKVTQLQNNLPLLWKGSAKEALSVIKAFNHLIKLVNEPGYKSNTPFE